MSEIKVTALAQDSAKTEIIMGKHRMYIDEPESFGGKDEAPSPVAVFLASLAGCVNAIGQWTAREMKIHIRSMKIDISGDVDSRCFLEDAEGVRAGFFKIRVFVQLDSDASASQLVLWKSQVLKRCPVIDNICHPTDFVMDLDAVNCEGSL